MLVINHATRNSKVQRNMKQRSKTIFPTWIDGPAPAPNCMDPAVENTALRLRLSASWKPRQVPPPADLPGSVQASLGGENPQVSWDFQIVLWAIRASVSVLQRMSRISASFRQDGIELKLTLTLKNHMKSTTLKWTVQWRLLHSRCCTTIPSVLCQTFSSPPTLPPNTD